MHSTCVHTTVHLSFDVVRSSSYRSTICNRYTTYAQIKIQANETFFVQNSVWTFFHCVTIYTRETGNLNGWIESIRSQEIALLFMFILESETCIVPIWSRDENKSEEVNQRNPHRAAKTYEKSLNYNIRPKWTPQYRWIA